MEAIARLSSKCAACQADSQLEIRQYIDEGRLCWKEIFACGCGHGFEAKDFGLPSPAARKALLEQHGESELWLDKAGAQEATVKVLTLFLGVSVEDVKARLEKLPAPVFHGTRVEAQFVAEALTRVTAEVRVVPRLPVAARPSPPPEPKVATSGPIDTRRFERMPHITRENAQVVLRQAIKELKANPERAVAIAQKILEVVRRAGTFGRLHASFEVLVLVLLRRKLALDFALTVARELISMQRDRTHLALLAEVLRAAARAEEADRIAEEARETAEEHGEVQRDFLQTCAALGVDPTQ